jgi:Stage II sporulation protein E (SpoIIE)
MDKSSRLAEGRLAGGGAPSRLADHTAELGPGDALVLFTDGLREAFAPDRIVTPPQLAAALASCVGATAGGIAREIGERLIEDGGSETGTTSSSSCCGFRGLPGAGTASPFGSVVPGPGRGAAGERALSGRSSRRRRGWSRR